MLKIGLCSPLMNPYIQGCPIQSVLIFNEIKADRIRAAGGIGCRTGRLSKDCVSESLTIEESRARKEGMATSPLVSVWFTAHSCHRTSSPADQREERVPDMYSALIDA